MFQLRVLIALLGLVASPAGAVEEACNNHPQAAFHDQWCWILSQNNDHGAACAEVGLVATARNVIMDWNAGRCDAVALALPGAVDCSRGDFQCCAEAMWCNPQGQCGTHNWGQSFWNYGHCQSVNLGEPGGFCVYTCVPLFQPQVCPGGQEPIPGGLGCQVCAAGTFSPDGSACQNCLEGESSDQEATICYDCPVGKSSIAGGQCEDCAAGEFSDEEGGACESCAAGTYSMQGGMSECLQCDPGRFSDAGADSCADCSPGTFADQDATTECQLCDAGTFSDTAGAAACAPCELGRFSDVGADLCTDCSPGTFADQDASTECQLCDAGTFSDTAGATACAPCPAGSTSVAGGPCIQCGIGTMPSAGGVCLPLLGTLIGAMPDVEITVERVTDAAAGDFESITFSLKLGKLPDPSEYFEDDKLQYVVDIKPLDTQVTPQSPVEGSPSTGCRSVWEGTLANPAPHADDDFEVASITRSYTELSVDCTLDAELAADNLIEREGVVAIYIVSTKQDAPPALGTFGRTNGEYVERVWLRYVTVTFDVTTVDKLGTNIGDIDLSNRFSRAFHLGGFESSLTLFQTDAFTTARAPADHSYEVGAAVHVDHSLDVSSADLDLEVQAVYLATSGTLTFPGDEDQVVHDLSLQLRMEESAMSQERFTCIARRCENCFLHVVSKVVHQQARRLAGGRRLQEAEEGDVYTLQTLYTSMKPPSRDSFAEGRPLVHLSMVVRNVDYNALVVNVAMRIRVIAELTRPVASRIGNNIADEHVLVTLSPGSVKADVTVKVPVGAELSAIQATIADPSFQSALGDDVTRSIAAVEGIDAIAHGVIATDVGVGEVEMPDEETAREPFSVGALEIAIFAVAGACLLGTCASACLLWRCMRARQTSVPKDAAGKDADPTEAQKDNSDLEASNNQPGLPASNNESDLSAAATPAPEDTTHAPTESSDLEASNKESGLSTPTPEEADEDEEVVDLDELSVRRPLQEANGPEQHVNTERDCDVYEPEIKVCI